MVFWVKFGNAFIMLFLVDKPYDALIQYKYPNRVYFHCKTKLEKYAFAQEYFHLQGIFSYINEMDSSSPSL